MAGGLRQQGNGQELEWLWEREKITPRGLRVRPCGPCWAQDLGSHPARDDGPLTGLQCPLPPPQPSLPPFLVWLLPCDTATLSHP